MIELYRPLLYSVIMKYKINGGVTYSCRYRVIWCSKLRRNVLVDGAERRLEELIKEVAVLHAAEIIKLEILPDQVHLLLEIDPQYGIHRLVRQLKGQTSRVLRQEFSWIKSRIPTLWTSNYLVCTVGEESVTMIERFIETQKFI